MLCADFISGVTVQAREERGLHLLLDIATGYSQGTTCIEHSLTGLCLTVVKGNQSKPDSVHLLLEGLGPRDQALNQGFGTMARNARVREFPMEVHATGAQQ